ncbi:hypothetical protein D3C85_1441540 [compost metagenome]
MSNVDPEVALIEPGRLQVQSPVVALMRPGTVDEHDPDAALAPANLARNCGSERVGLQDVVGEVVGLLTDPKEPLTQDVALIGVARVGYRKIGSEVAVVAFDMPRRGGYSAAGFAVNDEIERHAQDARQSVGQRAIAASADHRDDMRRLILGDDALDELGGPSQRLS